MMDFLSGIAGFLTPVFVPDVLIVTTAVAAAALVGRAYFRSHAADGRFTIEDWIAGAYLAMFTGAMVYGVWKGVA